MAQVSMNWAHRITQCGYCPNKIQTATPMVTVFHRGQTRNAKYYYHPDCWIRHGLDWLNSNPYVERAPKTVHLEPEQKAKRYKLLRTHASLKQRKQKLSRHNPHHTMLMNKLDAQIIQLTIAIHEVGGVPKKWVTELGG